MLHYEEQKISPGQALQILLSELFPPDPKDRVSFAAKLDSTLMADGELVELVYRSCINYMIRRLISAAEYFRRKNAREGFPERIFVINLRRFLAEETRIPSNSIEKVLVLLLECLHVRNKNPTRITGRRARRNAERLAGSRTQQGRCYICGNVLDFDEEGQPNSAEVEHIWPSAMGGANEDFNLALGCLRCNQAKADHIGASDFHYEEICLVSGKDDEHFPNEMCTNYRVALWTKSEYRCAVCGRPAWQVGELEFERRNPNDSWHFLNIDAYCAEHIPD